jgi:small subunit ribosomal protein S2
VSKMIELERLSGSPEWAQIPKKEALLMSRELIKLQRNLSGIRNMVRLPDAVFVLDTAIEHLAVTEANKLGIPVVAVVDTNVNPNLVQYPIPGNDDAIRANELMTRVIAEAISEGRFIAEKAGGQVQNPATAVVDNAVFAADQARARAEAAIAQAERDAKLAGESN